MNTRNLKLVAALACSAALPAALQGADAARSTSLDPIVIEEPDAEARTRCHADIDGDHAVGFEDLIAVLVGWGACPRESDRAFGESGAIDIVGCPADLDGNHAVDFRDLTTVLLDYGHDCGRNPEADPEPNP